MRLTRIAAGELRRDPAAVLDAVKAVGFFAGARVVLVEDATDSASAVVLGALKDWREGDARIVVTAGGLGAGSSLRKGFEAARNAVAVGIYDDPPGREEIEAALAAAGLARPDREAMGDIEGLARALDPGDFAQFVEKLGLYKRGDPAPLSAADVAACAPPTTEDVDEVLMLAADGAAGRLPRPSGRWPRAAAARPGSPSRRGGISARSTPRPAPPRGRRRRWRARGRRSSGRSGRAWRRRRGRSGRPPSSRR